MTNLPAKLEKEESLGLAQELLERRPRSGLPAALTLFNLGKTASILAMFMGMLLLWAFGSPAYMSMATSLITGTGILLAPLLAFGMLMGVRLGLLGVAEFFCGMTYLPLKAMSGPYSLNRSYQSMALICNGTGRFAEALKFFRLHEHHYNPFESNVSTAWNERTRAAELLSRLGRDSEAIALAASNVERFRKNLQDIDCWEMRETLQCGLISAANVCYAAKNADEVVPEAVSQYLQEAIDLDCPSSAQVTQTGGGKAATLDTGTKLLALHAAGLKYYYEKNYERAIGAFEECSENILSRRDSKAFGHQRNSELLGFNQYYLGQCYFKTGQHERIPPLLKLMESENKYEPAASLDIMMVEFTRADYEIALGNAEGALRILRRLIGNLSSSDAPFDSFLLAATERYASLVNSPEIERSIEHMRAQKNLQEEMGKPLLRSIDALSGANAAALRLPDLGATRRLANRSVVFFIGILAYTIYGYVTAPATFFVAGWALLCLVSGVGTVRQVSEQVDNRRCRALAAIALGRGQATDIVISGIGNPLVAGGMRTCEIVEGPQEAVGRKITFGVNNNLIYAGQVNTAAARKMRARLYRAEDGKILAVELLGRVLTVQKTV